MTDLLYAPAAPPAPTAAPATKPKRICFPLEGFTISGGVRVITQIANRMAARGHAVRLLVPDYQAAPPFPLDSRVEIQVVPTRGAGLLRKLRYWGHLARASTRNCDLCFATGGRTPFYLYLSSLLNRPRPRLVYLIQHYEVWSHAEQTPHPWLIRKLLALMIHTGYRLPFQQVAVAHWIRRKIHSPRCEVISNGVDVTIFQPDAAPRRNAKFVVGFIERAASWKGYDTFLRALNELPDSEKANFKILLASLDSVALPEGIETERCQPRTDAAMAEFYRRCDAFALASVIEGCPLPPLEAMACGAPLVTTDIGGVAEYASADNAILFPVGDSEALAAALLRLKNDPALCLRLREAGLETAQRFSLEVMQEKYVQWIEK